MPVCGGGGISSRITPARRGAPEPASYMIYWGEGLGAVFVSYVILTDDYLIDLWHYEKFTDALAM